MEGSYGFTAPPYTEDFCAGNYETFQIWETKIPSIRNQNAIFRAQSPPTRLHGRFSCGDYSKVSTWSLTSSSLCRKWDYCDNYSPNVLDMTISRSLNFGLSHSGFPAKSKRVSCRHPAKTCASSFMSDRWLSVAINCCKCRSPSRSRIDEMWFPLMFKTCRQFCRQNGTPKSRMDLTTVKKTEIRLRNDHNIIIIISADKPRSRNQY